MQELVGSTPKLRLLVAEGLSAANVQLSHGSQLGGHFRCNSPRQAWQHPTAGRAGVSASIRHNSTSALTRAIVLAICASYELDHVSFGLRFGKTRRVHRRDPSSARI